MAVYAAVCVTAESLTGKSTKRVGVGDTNSMCTYKTHDTSYLLLVLCCVKSTYSNTCIAYDVRIRESTHLHLTAACCAVPVARTIPPQLRYRSFLCGMHGRPVSYSSSTRSSRTHNCSCCTKCVVLVSYMAPKSTSRL